MIRIFLVFLLSILYIQIIAQQTIQYKSPIQEQYEYYSKLGLKMAQEFDSLHGITPNSMQRDLKSKACSLNKEVYGWYPYWVGSAYTNLDYDLISTFSFLGYDVEPSTGNYKASTQSSINTWNSTTGSVQHSLNKGVRVELTVFCFGNSNNATFLGNATSRQTCITNLVNLVKNRGAHGVNVDFENVPLSQKANLVTFFKDLSQQLKSAVAGATVTAACPPYDWDNSWDLPALVPYVDRFIIMGYDFYYAGGPNAGPVGLTYKATGGWATFTNQFIGVNYYLNNGVPKSKLILGFPYYGRDWEVTSHGLPANTISGGNVNSRTYTTVKDNQATYGAMQTHQNLRANYYNYNTSKARQLWIDEEDMLREKYDAVKRIDLAGIGIFALGYDDGYNQLWDALSDKFSTCGKNECTGRVFDLGGPDGTHYSNINNTFTIAPDSATSVELNFTVFDMGTGDELKIYDGASTSAPLIGTYAGSVLPNKITSTTGLITIKENSDASGTGAGYDFTYTCKKAPPVAPLISGFKVSSTNICKGEKIAFTDTSKGTISIKWDFGGAKIDTSSIKNPSVEYDSSGIYNIQLITTGGNNQKDTVVKAINVNIYEYPNADFSFTSMNTLVDFENKSTTATGSTWLFGDGSTNSNFIKPTHNYPALGSYDVTLIASNGNCNDTITKTINLFATSVSDGLNKNHIKIFPNPSEGVFSVLGDGIGKIEIYNINGQLVQMNNSNSDIQSFSLDTKGVYFLKISINDNFVLIKVMVF